MMTYGQALEYIHSINWCFCKPGLERIGELCEMLGNPQRSLKFIHVAGTNGKGSFCSMLDSVLREAGYKTGLFTSPYVRKFNERMAVNGESISDTELADITEYVSVFAERMQEKPTEFELITAIAFEYFKRNACEIVVLEAGMGGRLDSTNIIDAPLVSVITGIALDHTAYLGDTVEKIAAEKAGIIKRGAPILFGGDCESAARVIRAKANEQGVEFRQTDRKAIAVKKATLDGTCFSYGENGEFELGLLGLYQPFNAANVIECVGLLRSVGAVIPEKALKNGLKRAKWSARFELLRRDPIILFDGSHNPEGIDAAVRTVKHYFGEKRVRVITGLMADKDYNYMVKAVSSIACKVYTVKPDNPRALDAGKLAAEYAECGVEVHPFDSVDAAISAVLAEKEQIPTVALGSLYMYCEFADALEAYGK